MIKNILDRFRRITSTNNYIAEIDGLRFLAIASVCLFHIHNYAILKNACKPESSGLESYINSVLTAGCWGVELFFCLSGFILSYPFADYLLNKRKKIILSTYYWRRLTRIEPPYICALLICSMILIATGKMEHSEWFPNLIASLFYSHELLINGPNIILPVAWSLEIEAQFYLLAPLLVQVFKLNALTRRSIFFLMIITVSIIQPLIQGFPNSIVSELQYFTVGFLISDLYLNGYLKNEKFQVLWDWVGIISFLCIILITKNSALNFLIPFLLAIVIIVAFKGVIFRSFFRIPLIAITGGMCYSIYLCHFNIISISGKLISQDEFGYLQYITILIIVAVPVILIFSGVFYLTIERPCMRPDWFKLVLRNIKFNKK